MRYNCGAGGPLTSAGDAVSGIRTEQGEEFAAGAVVLACGGFEANAEMRVQHLGPEWQQAKVRGTEFNTGEGIRIALDAGAARYGDWGACHAVAWDLNAPPYGNRRIGDLYQKH